MTGIVEKTAVKNLAERMYAELNEILAKDLGAQRELSEKFKDSDDALRTQLERIEASAAGLSSDGTSYRDVKVDVEPARRKSTHLSRASTKPCSGRIQMLSVRSYSIGATSLRFLNSRKSRLRLTPTRASGGGDDRHDVQGGHRRCGRVVAG